ncbi:MAG: hypothetical protein JO256_03560 [Alphaproteobacteria bacterium]|nr:hypothetical protein [Alphaproteobacteria bacterium]
MPSTKPQIHSLFATPLCVHFVPVAVEMNADLKPLILERTRQAQSRGQGAYAKEDFRSWGNHHAQTLLAVVTDLADSLTASRSGGRIKTEWKIACRAAARVKGEYQEMVARPGAFWAGVYFADDGYAKSDDEELGGQCELGDPRGPLPAMVAPQLSFRMPGGTSAGFAEIIRPQSGMILLHPGWQPRGERRYEGEGQRLVIEFELTAPV